MERRSDEQGYPRREKAALAASVAVVVLEAAAVLLVQEGSDAQPELQRNNKWKRCRLPVCVVVAVAVAVVAAQARQRGTQKVCVASERRVDERREPKRE